MNLKLYFPHLLSDLRKKFRTTELHVPMLSVTGEFVTFGTAGKAVLLSRA
jgi:hypothetical protein